MLKYEFDEVKELSVKDLTVDNKLDVIFLDHLSDPARDVWLNAPKVDLNDFLFFWLRVLEHYLTNRPFDCALID